jgi:hypothetical protein
VYFVRSAVAQVVELEIPLQPKTKSDAIRSLAAALEVFLYDRIGQSNENPPAANNNGIPEWLRHDLLSEQHPKSADDHVSTSSSPGSPPSQPASVSDHSVTDTTRVEDTASWNLVNSDNSPPPSHVRTTGLRHRHGGSSGMRSGRIAGHDQRTEVVDHNAGSRRELGKESVAGQIAGTSVHARKVLAADLDSRRQFHSFADHSAHLLQSSHVAAGCYFLIDTDKVLRMRVPFTPQKRAATSSSQDPDLTYRLERSALLLAVTELLQQNNINVME